MGENLTLTGWARRLRRAWESADRYNPVDADAYRSFGFPGADEMGNMFQVYRDFEKEVPGAPGARRHALAQSVGADL